MLPNKPLAIFDRDHDWRELARFATDASQGATLGVLSGRRRQGKTLLLYSLAQVLDGFYFAATEATRTQSLSRLSEVLRADPRADLVGELTTWDQAVDALLALGRSGPTLVVIDEFPYLAQSSGELASTIQAALTPGRPQRTESQTRLLLCGSAMSFMGGLLSGRAPLRGRAGLELRVRPLDYRLAAEFWDITDPRLAVLVYSIVGGTPAYRREYVRNDAPAGVDDFDDWVARTVLNPASPLFLEPRYLLAEDTGRRDPALYHSVLSAVAEGNATLGGIANAVGRKSNELRHPLTVLEDAGLLHREPDLLRSGRSTYQITEPLIAFYQAIMRRDWTALERGQATTVWRRSQARFNSAVVGPWFEFLCREWLLLYADPAAFGGGPLTIGRGVVNDPTARVSHELDIVVLGEPGPTGRPLLAIGEAKWGTTLGMAHLERLRRARDLLANRGLDTSATSFICASGKGFHPDLVTAAEANAVTLVDPQVLYTG